SGPRRPRPGRRIDDPHAHYVRCPQRGRKSPLGRPGGRLIVGLAKRVIPCLDIAEGRVVKGVNFVNLRDAGDPVEVARRYDTEGADELAFLYIRGGRTPTGIDAIQWAAETAALGAGEILLTSMDRDGARSGFDLKLTRAVVDAVDVPVIASGGVGSLNDLVEGIARGGADAVLAASIFHYGEFTVGEAKAALAAAGIEIRIVG